jgi:hypothetical protein
VGFPRRVCVVHALMRENGEEKEYVGKKTPTPPTFSASFILRSAGMTTVKLRLRFSTCGGLDTEASR